MFGDVAVLARPGADERKPEVLGTQHAVTELGYRVEQIVAPGTLDGGDVLQARQPGLGRARRPHQSRLELLNLRPYSDHWVRR